MLIVCAVCYSLYLVANNLVLVDGRTQNEVRSLLLNEDVAVGADLVEPCGSSDSKDSFPCVLSRQTVVKLISKFHAVRVLIKVRVEE